MSRSERIAYDCAGTFVYEGDLVSVPDEEEPWAQTRVVGVVLGKTSVMNSEPYDHLRILTEAGVYIVPRRLVIPWEGV